MEQYITYAFQSIVCSGALYLFYKTVLEGKTDYTFCRVYLICSVILSAAIPLLRLKVLPAQIITLSSIPTYSIDYAVADSGSAAAAPAEPAAYLLWLYITVSLLLAARILWQVIRINRYMRGARVSFQNNIRIYESGSIKTPFAFFSRVFIPSGLPERDRGQILLHECSHARHHHGAEVMVMELLKAAMWYNPFVWLARRALDQVHEYQADSAVLETVNDATDYKTLLFRQLLGYSPDISSGLACSKTKKRFIMMERTKPGPRTILRASAAIPIIGAMLALFSFTAKDPVYLFEDVPVTVTVPEIQEQGAMYYFIDGREVTKDEVDRLDPEKIESVNMTSDSTTLEKYGKDPRAAGAVLIVTKDAVTAAAVPAPGIDRIEAGSDPDVYIDNVKVDRKALEALDPDRIHSISVIKQKADNGTDGAENNGVIYVTTKEYNDRNPGEQPQRVIKVNRDGSQVEMTTDGSVLIADSISVDLSPRKVSSNVYIMRSDTTGGDSPKIEVRMNGKQIEFDPTGTTVTGENRISVNGLDVDLGQLENLTRAVTGGISSVEVVDRDENVTIRVDGNEVSISELKNLSQEIIKSVNVQKDSDGSYRASVDITTKDVPWDEEPIFMIEEMPRFNGGDIMKFKLWVQENLKYPAGAAEEKIQGRVVVSFWIDRRGKLTDITVLSSPDERLTEETLRVLKLSPRWKPGSQRGENVAIKLNMPVEFQL